MLNPSFPKSANQHVSADFVAERSIAQRTLHGNEFFDTGREYRMQPVYGDEVWLKLERAGLTPRMFEELSVLEVCAGTGFLTFHLLSRCKPKSLTVNDISASELRAARDLVESNVPGADVTWVVGDMHSIVFPQKFDVIIGNSFIHHFYNVPQVLSKFHSLLTDGGVFISLHEPTPMATIVEGAKLVAYPLGVIAPGLVNDIARARHRGEPSPTDLWMFEPPRLKRVAERAGFRSVSIYPWHLVRTVSAEKRRLHLSAQKPRLSNEEMEALRKSIRLDGWLNRILPQRFFGSICIACLK
jgi:ubiquinone/menaquinone biosynthesis C-methylase UbiE